MQRLLRAATKPPKFVEPAAWIPTRGWGGVRHTWVKATPGSRAQQLVARCGSYSANGYKGESRAVPDIYAGLSE